MELCCTLLMEEQGWESQKCSAHCLQLCINGDPQIPVIARLLGAYRRLVGHFHYSAVATKALQRRCTQMEVTQKKLINDCSTRWNSSFHMMKRLILLSQPVSAVLSDDSVIKRAERYLELKTNQ